jgi:DNA-binding NtrC family response regulator
MSVHSIFNETRRLPRPPVPASRVTASPGVSAISATASFRRVEPVLWLVLENGPPIALDAEGWVRVRGTVVAEVVHVAAGQVTLEDATGRGIGCRGSRHRELCVGLGDALSLEIPGAQGRSVRVKALVARPVVMPVPIPTERPPIVWRSMVAASEAGYRVLFALALAAEATAPLWIRGESGTGKELAAAAAHFAGPRARGPFEALNCAALPAELVESELFGVERGAYTGASRTRPGAFVRAHGGTLFLDEIGELPMAAQAKVLRALEQGEVRPVGADRAVKVDVRVVVASWRDLEAEVEAGRFRHDLLHRLCVLEVVLPALRERPDDIAPILAELLAPSANERAAESLGDPLWPDPALLTKLRDAAWPGNIRELKNGALRAMATQDPHDLLGRSSLRLVERPRVNVALKGALDLFKNNRSRTARALGVSRSTLYRWLARAS